MHPSESGVTLSRTRVPLRPTVVISLASTAALLLYEILFRYLRPEDLFSSNQVKTVPYLFQTLASDDLMQTVKIQELSNFGPMGLWYFHIYPPLHQALLYVLALPNILTNQPVSSEVVDLRLYVVYAIIFGLLNAIIFMWVRDITRSTRLGLIVVILWSIYPGNLQMATLVDGTYLSLYLTTLTFYFLYRFLRTRHAKYLTYWLISVAVTTYARPLFQWQLIIPVVLVVGLFMYLSRRTSRGWLIVVDVLMVCLIVALPVKSYLMWGSLSTTTYAGFHRTGMLYYDPSKEMYDAVQVPPQALANAEVFKSAYNLPLMVTDNYAREQLANEWIASHSLTDLTSVLAKSFNTNFQNALIPTSEYFPNQLSQDLPWRALMDRILSGYLYLFLGIGSVVAIFALRGLQGSVGLLRRYGWLVGYYLMLAGTIALQNRNEWTEASRLKIFIEIPVWIAAAYLVHLIGVRLQQRKTRRRSPETRAQ
jgi:hypothetical protein